MAARVKPEIAFTVISQRTTVRNRQPRGLADSFREVLRDAPAVNRAEQLPPSRNFSTVELGLPTNRALLIRSVETLK